MDDLSLAVLWSLAVLVGVKALPGLFALSFAQALWDPPRELSPWPLVAGSVVTVGGGLLLAAPVALAVALRLAAEGRRTSRFLGLMARLPSVVVGLVGIDDLLPVLAKVGIAFGAVATSMALAVVLLPLLVDGFLPPIAQAFEDLGEEMALLGLSEARARRLVARRALPGLSTALAGAASRGLGESVVGALLLGGGVGFPTPTGPANSLAAALLTEGAGAPPGSRWWHALLGLAALLGGLALAADRLAGRGREGR